MSRNSRTAVAMVAMGSIIFGFLGIPVRSLNAAGLDSMDLVMIRSVLSAIGLILITLVVDRSAFRISGKRDIILFILFGLSKFLCDISYVYAQLTIDLSVSTLLLMTSPYYVLVFSFLMFSERITKHKVAAVFIGFLGCVLVTNVLGGDIGSINIFGTVCAALSGLFFSLYVVFSRVCTDRGNSPLTTILYAFIIEAVLSIPFADLGLVSGVIVQTGPLMDLTVMVVLMTIIPYYIETWGIQRLTPSIVAILGMLELVTACIVGYVFFGESMTTLNALGMGLIIASILLIDLMPGPSVKDDISD